MCGRKYYVGCECIWSWQCLDKRTLDDVYDEEIRNQLKQWGIPERHQVWAMIALGYPEGEAKSPKRNLDVVHYVK